MSRLLPLLGLAAAFLASIQAAAQTAAPVLHLEQALERAAARSPAVAAARNGLAAGDGAVQQAQAGPNPTLQASLEDFRRQTRTTTAILELPLERGGKRAARVRAAERARDLLQAELASALAQVRAEVIAAYAQVLVARERARIAAGAVQLARRGADIAQRQVQAGKVSPVQETRARVDVANAQLEADQAAAELEGARQTLAALIGEPQPRFVELAPLPPGPPERPPLEQLLARLESAPAWRASRAELERRRALVEVERARAQPDLTVSVGVRRDNDLGRTQAVVGLSVPLPLVDRNDGAIREAARLADRAGDELEATRLRLASELRQAAQRLALARRSAAAVRDDVLPVAQDAWQAAVTGFEAGKFNFLEVLDAQRSLLAARTRYLDSLSAAWQAASSIDRIVGE